MDVISNKSMCYAEAADSNYQISIRVIFSLIFLCMLIGTALGNFLVILAVFIVKKLKTPSNLLIVSLAFSDLLVAILVLPFNILDFVTGYWPFNKSVCGLYISFDVLLCTASILNLCVISIDRYLVITKPMEYSMYRKNWLMGVYILIAWSISTLITLPSTFHWKPKSTECRCDYNDNTSYQIYAVFCAFYIPLLIMLVLYGRIFKLARDITLADKKQKSFTVNNNANSPSYQQVEPKRNSSTSAMQQPDLESANRLIQQDSTNQEPQKKGKTSNSETKAIKTLGIIMGGFCLCWLPFFIVQLVKALYASQGKVLEVPVDVFRFLGWLGYLNSLLNPIIYAKFNQEFRLPFKMILMCKCRDINAQLRKKTYKDDFGENGNFKRVKRDQPRSIS